MGRDRYYDSGRYAGCVRFVVMVVILPVLCVLCGCTRKVYVPVERVVVRSDTLRENLVRVDSVMERDSVVVMQRGDTVYSTRWRERVRVRELRDTVYKVLRDSVRCPVPYPVERKLTSWERAKMSIGGPVAVIVVIVAAIVVIRLLRARGRQGSGD